MSNTTTTIDLNRRLSVLEARIGITTGTGDGASTSSRNNNTNNNAIDDNVNERLLKLRLNYERKIAEAASSSVNSSTSASAGVSSNTNTNTSNNATKELWIECIKLLNELDPDIGLTHQQQPLLYKRQQVLASSYDLIKDFSELNIILNLLLKGTTTRKGINGINNGTSSMGAGGGGISSNDVFKSNTAVGNDGGGGGGKSYNKDNDTINKAAAGQSSLSLYSSSEKQQQLDKSKQQNKQDEEQRRQQQQRSSASADGLQNQLLRLDQVTQAPILTEYYAGTAINPIEQKRIETLRIKLLDLNNRTTNLSQQLRYYLECYHTTMQAVSNKIILANEKIKN
jgi:hypothetical protein